MSLNVNASFLIQEFLILLKLKIVKNVTWDFRKISWNFKMIF